MVKRFGELLKIDLSDHLVLGLIISKLPLQRSLLKHYFPHSGIMDYPCNRHLIESPQAALTPNLVKLYQLSSCQVTGAQKWVYRLCMCPPIRKSLVKGERLIRKDRETRDKFKTP